MGGGKASSGASYQPHLSQNRHHLDFASSGFVLKPADHNSYLLSSGMMPLSGGAQAVFADLCISLRSAAGPAAVIA